MRNGQEKQALPTLTVLRYVNNEYRNQASEMEFRRLTYIGGAEYLHGNYLFRHGRETIEDYQRRLQRAYFQNFCAPVIDLYAGFLMSQTIKRENNFTRKNEWINFLSDATAEGQPFDTFMSELIRWTAAIGKSYVLVDRTQGEVQTKAEEFEAGIRTYIQRIPWENLIDWEKDNIGKYLWVKIKETVRGTRNWTANENIKTRYRIWTRETWEIYETDGNNVAFIAGGINPIGIVPIVEIEWPGGSLIKDACRINRSIFNLCSLLDESLYRQCFPQFCYPGDLPNEFKLGTATCLTFDPTGPAPLYIAPPSDPNDFLLRMIQHLSEVLNKILVYKADVEGFRPESGIARAYSFSQLNNVLLGASKNFAQAEEEIFRLFAMWEQEPTDGIKIQYPQTFDIVNIESMIDEAIKAQMLSLGSKFERYLKKKIVRGIVDPRDIKEREEIEEEIDSGVTDLKQLPPIAKEYE